MVAAHLARHKQYPASARSAGAQGIATVTFSIDGNGRVTAARLAAGSGNPAIDQEVVAMARRASPFQARRMDAATSPFREVQSAVTYIVDPLHASRPPAARRSPTEECPCSSP
jgi:TonB family protein